MTYRLERVCMPSSEARLFLLMDKLFNLASGAKGVRVVMLFCPISNFSKFLQFLMGSRVLI